MGQSAAIVALRAQIQRLAAFDGVSHPLVLTILLRGEAGTGKGFVARVIYDSGPRSATEPCVGVGLAPPVNPGFCPLQ